MSQANTLYFKLQNQPSGWKVDSTFVRLSQMNEVEVIEASIAPVAPTFVPRIDEASLPPLDFKVRDTDSGFGVFVFYLLVVVMWSFLFRRNYKTITVIGKSVFSNNTLFQMLDGRGGLNTVVSLSTFIIGVMVISMFLFQVLQLYPINGYWFGVTYTNSLAFIVFALVVLVLFVKTIIVLFSSFIFNAQNAFTMYLSLNIMSIQFIGLILFPIVVLFSYGYALNPTWVLGFGAILVGALFVYRLLRTIFLGVKQTNSQVFHIILYICALEILPILVAARLVLQS